MSFRITLGLKFDMKNRLFGFFQRYCFIGFLGWKLFVDGCSREGRLLLSVPDKGKKFQFYPF